MNSVVGNCDNSKHFYVLLLFFTAIVLVNILTVGTFYNLLITIPQICLVIACMLNRDIKGAVLFHFCFVMLSLSAQSSQGFFEDSEDFPLFNYGTMKLIGPVRIFYFFNVVFVLWCYFGKYQIRRGLLVKKLIESLLYLAIPATLIGFLGLVFHPYYKLDGFVTPFVYMFATISTAYILGCLASDTFLKQVYNLSIICLFAGIIGSYMSYLLGVMVSFGSTISIIYSSDIVYFGAILVPGMLFIRKRFLLLISILLFLLISMQSTSGKGVYSFVFSFICLFYYLYFDKSFINANKRTIKIMRPIIMASFILFVFFITAFAGQVTLHKMNSALSMFSTELDEVASSPYIRIASLMNIINDGLDNVLCLIFGNGYGGYFEDNLGLFTGLDLTKGAWNENTVATGRFTSGHDTMVTVPLFNGIMGVWLIFRIVFKYMKNINNSYMSLMSILWIILMFYFNTILAVIGVFFLLGAEYPVNKEYMLKGVFSIK